MNLTRYLSSVALLLFFASSVNAAAIQCTGCSESVYPQRAMQLGRGTHVVFDLLNRRAAAFTVIYDTELRMWDVKPSALAPEAAEWVSALADYYADTGGLMSKTVEVSSEQLGIVGLGGASAYDVLRDRNLRVRIGDRLATAGIPAADGTRAFTTMVDVARRIGYGTTGWVDGVTIDVRIVFTDGASMTFRVTPDSLQAPYLEGSARSASGEGLLEANTREYEGTYNLPSSQESEQFLRRAGELGVRIVRVGGASGGGRFSCTFDGTLLTCRIF